MEDATMSEKDVLAEIEQEIERTKKGQGEDFEIEVFDEKKEAVAETAEEIEDPVPEDENKEAEAEVEAKEDKKDPEYSKKVQRRIKKLVEQRKMSEAKAFELEAENNAIKKRLEKLEQGSQSQAQTQFNQRYDQTKLALRKAVEEGDTDAQIDFQEQLADMRATVRISEMQQQQQVNQPPRASQNQQAPSAQAADWVSKNNWFNTPAYGRETAAARAIDVQLDLEGYDKNTNEYFEQLNSRLQKVFPDVVSEPIPMERSKTKRRNPVAPTSGGQPYNGNRVRLSQDQLSMARELGITDEQSLKKYESEIRRQKRN
tara:strand:+ start:22 stop:966 length:945 start_codon:yes stop_codon:yes gene_type:complete